MAEKNMHEELELVRDRMRTLENKMDDFLEKNVKTNEKTILGKVDLQFLSSINEKQSAVLQQQCNRLRAKMGLFAYKYHFRHLRQNKALSEFQLEEFLLDHENNQQDPVQEEVVNEKMEKENKIPKEKEMAEAKEEEEKVENESENEAEEDETEDEEDSDSQYESDDIESEMEDRDTCEEMEDIYTCSETEDEAER